MNNQEILTKAIQKAIANGWKQPQELSFISNDEFLVYLTESTPGTLKWIKFKLSELIYNHEFAKALWGEPYVMSHKEIKEAGYTGGGGTGSMIDMKHPGWKHHLQQMVIAEDPIKYLSDNL